MRASGAVRGAPDGARGVLGAALDESFFRSWGWLAGPGVWAACALLVAVVLGLPRGWTLLGAALSGLPSLVAVLADVHWAGTPLATAEVAEVCEMDRQDAREALGRVATERHVGADGFWTLAA